MEVDEKLSMAARFEIMNKDAAAYAAAAKKDKSQILDQVVQTAATIDRYLAPALAKDPIRGKPTTKQGTMLRNSITIRKAGDEVEAEPGFCEADTVAHCGPSLKDEFCRSVNSPACTAGGSSPTRSATTPTSISVPRSMRSSRQYRSR